MKASLLSLMLLFAFNASADVVKCSFTEPFYNLEIDTQAKTLKMIAPDFDSEDGGIKTTVLSTNVTVEEQDSTVLSQVAKTPKYKVLADGQEVLVLELNYEGSDGMSDYVYPYSTKHGDNHGGCESDRLKKLNSVYEENINNGGGESDEPIVNEETESEG